MVYKDGTEFKVFEGFYIYHYEVVHSTNTKALDLINRKVISGESAIISNRQKYGRGRAGKRWISPKGNFYASLVVDPLYRDSDSITSMEDLKILFQNKEKNFIKLTELIFVTTVAVGYTLTLFIGNAKIQYKWPNDILIDGKKICGILFEKKSNSSLLVIGIGININYAPFLRATCMISYGRFVSNTDLLKVLLINFNKLRRQWIFEGFYVIREIWMKKAFRINELISIKLGDKLQYDGVFLGIDETGRLILRQRDGSLIYSCTGEFLIDGDVS